MNHLPQISPEQIGFDIDGVVADTSEAFIRLARQQHGFEHIQHEQITEFEVADCLPMKPAIIEEIFGFLLEDPISADLHPMPHAVEVLTAMSAEAPLTFITARPQRQPIADWLELVLGPEVCGHARLVAMGEHDGKASYIKKMDLHYFIDDRAETCMNLKEQGITPIVFNQPWNRGKHDLPSVDSWLCIQKMVLPASSCATISPPQAICLQ